MREGEGAGYRAEQGCACSAAERLERGGYERNLVGIEGLTSSCPCGFKIRALESNLSLDLVFPLPLLLFWISVVFCKSEFLGLFGVDGYML